MRDLFWWPQGAFNRRHFIGGLALATLAASPRALAQPPRKVYRIGVMSTGFSTSDIAGPDPREPHVRALLRGLREHGYVYGEHFVTEPRGGEGKHERFAGLAADLAGLQPDVIVAGGPMLPFIKQATSTIAVVMAAAADPVEEGYVQSLRRPGRNFTGLSLQLLESTGKRLELLKALVPGSAPVAVMWSRVDRSRPSLAWQAAEAAARDRGWKLVSFEVRDAAELDGAFKQAARARAGTLLVHPTGLLDAQARHIADLAAKARLPAVYARRLYVEAGGLMSYAADTVEIYRRAATYVDKILKGSKPADLPVEQPTTFELIVNLKTAKTLRLTIPPSLLQRADQVIE